MDRIGEIFKAYMNIKDRYFISVDQMKSTLGDAIDNIVLYGAGSAGIAFLYYLREVGIYPKFFADGNPLRWGDFCEGIEIIDYKTIVDRLGDKALVIITINTDGVRYCKSFDKELRVGGHTGVHSNLYKAGCRHILDYTYFRQCRDLFRGDRYNLPSCSDIYEIEQNEDRISKAYELLDDEKSKDIFEKILRFRLVDDSIHIPTESQERQYFEYLFFPKIKNEIFVDCGAFNGISLQTFLHENDNCFLKYYGIEPDEKNYKVLEEFVFSLPNILKGKMKLINRCVYDNEEELMLYNLSGPGSFVSDLGKQTTRGVRIDDIIEDDGVTFIKMNIEGSEIKALKGAKKALENYKPRLAIAGYHKTHDLWEIPLLIKEYNEEYKIHLRSYMNNLSFVFYGE